MCGTHVRYIGALDTAGVFTVTPVNLIVLFVAGDTDLFSVDHNDVVTRVDVWCVFRLVLATQAMGDFGRDSTEHLVFCVYDPPASINVLAAHAYSFHFILYLFNPIALEPIQVHEHSFSGPTLHRNRLAYCAIALR